MRGSGLEAKDLQAPSLPPGYLASSTEVALALHAILCLKHPKEKTSPRSSGASWNNRPTPFDAKNLKMVSPL